MQDLRLFFLSIFVFVGGVHDSFVNICKSAENGAVWITNYGRLKRTQVKGQCKRIRKHAIRFRTRRGEEMLSFKVLILLIMVWSIQGVGGKPMCDPEDHKYYHIQADTCLQCEKCLQGEEAISLEDWNVDYSDPEKGPTECRLCPKCQLRTYSDKQSYKCKPCRNCTLYNQYQVSQCTATSDTVCDGVKPTTPRSSTMKTSEPDPVKQNENDEDLNGSLTITGFICATVFIIVVIMIGFCSTKKFWCSGGNESEVDSVVTKSTASDLSKDVKIDFESDSQPLLQKGCESQIEKKPIELQMLGANPNEMDLLHANYRLTVDNLRAVAKELVSGYLFFEVARDFKMEEADIEAVKIDNEKYNNVRETSYQMLLLITKKRGKITLHELRNSLQKHDRTVYEKVFIALDHAGSNDP